jgi:hypothetical protein
MSDEITRAEFESLKRRVQALEEGQSEQDADHTVTDRSGIDHRDAAVIESLSEGTDYHGRGLVRKYLHHTDIVNDETAKARARRLHTKSCFDGETFVGWGDE